MEDTALQIVLYNVEEIQIKFAEIVLQIAFTKYNVNLTNYFLIFNILLFSLRKKKYFIISVFF